MMVGHAAVHDGVHDATDRENGSRNLRMLPAACLAWAVALLVPWFLDRSMGGSAAGSAKGGDWTKSMGESKGDMAGGSTAGGGMGMAVWMTPLVLALPLILATLLLAIKFVCLVVTENPDCRSQVFRRPHRLRSLNTTCGSAANIRDSLVSTWFGPQKLPTLAVLATVALAAALAAAVGHESVRSGPASRQIRQGKAMAEVRGKAVGPMSASSRRGWDCQVELRLQWVTVAGVRMPSDERIVLFARSRSCLLQQGGQYRARGLLEPSAYGRPMPWLAVEGGLKEVRPPGPGRRLIARMQNAFLEQASRLDDQGRILVPGLTMGILGNQALPGSGGSLSRPAVEPAYAARLTQDFRASGILHLMAVSGGHFMILASLLVSIMRSLRSPPLLMALVLSAAYLGLGMLMVPGDSVLRAQAMGLLSALALAVCRPAQSLNTLSWCVLLVLILRPSMASSFGFALSCGAVLGIGLGNRRLTALLEDHLPALLARPLATTLCAQAGTLPVQVLMSPGLPLLAPLANLLVTPVVDAATVTGLLALLTSWLWPPLGLLLARLTSLGTGVMAFAATWLGEAAAPAAWPSGPVGSACLLGLGLMVVIDHRLVRLIRTRRWDRSWSAVADEDSGVPFRPSAWGSIKVWLRQTYGLLAQLVFKKQPKLMSSDEGRFES
ncbi:hypothetical protein GKC41_07530 [Bifidobacterium asteroides]|uniref:ComEC/Rec2-related protein domain-containing protein n=1 Tax=Bifidobacterium asteroides TaxID=1684 RepID=A0A6N7TVB1_9BIFI|nr:hypothetical protein [Bifidobacterium asteroides]